MMTSLMASSDATTRTVITPQGYHFGKCGYCGSKANASRKSSKAGNEVAGDRDGSLEASETSDDKQREEALEEIDSEGNQSYYVSAVTLSVEDYQKLLDRGWRRSGKLLYKQNRKVSCCPHYTIRLEASKYEPTYDHRTTLNRWNKFVLGEEYLKQTADQAARDAAKSMELVRQRRAAKKAQQEGKLKGENFEKSVHASEYETVEREREEAAKRVRELAHKHKARESRTEPSHPEPAHKLEIVLEPSKFTEEKFLLFQKYQVNVHHERPEKQTHDSFKRFLCQTPLKHSVGTTAADEGRKYGSYHQLYRLDGRLIAMAVLDLLPNCVSSVYFMYDTAYHKYSMGKLSACREIELAREGGYDYYYLGYYIHGNKKMEYKALFPPAELLDPESNIFHPIEEFVPPDKSRFKGLGMYRYFSVDNPEENCRPRRLEENTKVSGFDGRFHTLWDRKMPGITPLAIIKELPLGDIHIQVGGMNAKAKQLRGFKMSEIEEETSITRHIAEMAAVMGPDVVMDAIVEF